MATSTMGNVGHSWLAFLCCEHFSICSARSFVAQFIHQATTMLRLPLTAIGLGPQDLEQHTQSINRRRASGQQRDIHAHTFLPHSFPYPPLGVQPPRVSFSPLTARPPILDTAVRPSWHHLSPRLSPQRLSRPSTELPAPRSRHFGSRLERESTGVGYFEPSQPMRLPAGGAEADRAPRPRGRRLHSMLSLAQSAASSSPRQEGQLHAPADEASRTLPSPPSPHHGPFVPRINETRRPAPPAVMSHDTLRNGQRERHWILQQEDGSASIFEESGSESPLSQDLRRESYQEPDVDDEDLAHSRADKTSPGRRTELLSRTNSPERGPELLTPFPDLLSESSPDLPALAAPPLPHLANASPGSPPSSFRPTAHAASGGRSSLSPSPSPRRARSRPAPAGSSSSATAPPRARWPRTPERYAHFSPTPSPPPPGTAHRTMPVYNDALPAAQQPQTPAGLPRHGVPPMSMTAPTAGRVGRLAGTPARRARDGGSPAGGWMRRRRVEAQENQENDAGIEEDAGEARERRAEVGVLMRTPPREGQRGA